jgi:hypothetical protein
MAGPKTLVFGQATRAGEKNLGKLGIFARPIRRSFGQIAKSPSVTRLLGLSLEVRKDWHLTFRAALPVCCLAGSVKQISRAADAPANFV